MSQEIASAFVRLDVAPDTSSPDVRDATRVDAISRREDGGRLGARANREYLLARHLRLSPSTCVLGGRNELKMPGIDTGWVPARVVGLHTDGDRAMDALPGNAVCKPISEAAVVLRVATTDPYVAAGYRVRLDPAIELKRLKSRTVTMDEPLPFTGLLATSAFASHRPKNSGKEAQR